MNTMLLIGDSYMGLSEQYLAIGGLEYGYATDGELIDPSKTALAWLLTGRDQLRAKANAMDPDETVVLISLGGADAMDASHVWTATEIGSFIDQIHYEFRAFRTFHLGYEWWPTDVQNLGFERFYDSIRETRKSSHAHWIEMRGVVQPPVYADALHLTPDGYQQRVNHLRKVWFAEILDSFS